MKTEISCRLSSFLGFRGLIVIDCWAFELEQVVSIIDFSLLSMETFFVQILVVLVFQSFSIVGLSILRFSLNTQTPKWVVSFENSLVSLCCTGSSFLHGFLAVIINWIQTGSMMSVGLSNCDFRMFLILFLTRVSF